MQIIVLLLCLGLLSAGTEASHVNDFQYNKACGPIACFIAMRYYDYNVSLEQVAMTCSWKTGEPTTLKQIRDTIQSYGLRCEARRFSPDRLYEYLEGRNGIAVLPIRKFGEEIDHVVVALCAGNHYITTIDYPELIQDTYLDQFTDKWDGQVLLVSPKKYYPSHVFVVISIIVTIGIMYWRRFIHK
jgi:ABC-type bacteriocin/lantibiotic exporter with double-glycine peptidase domain